MSKKPSMEDIARKLGISRNTVSLALRGMPGISSKTREMIISTAKELGYNYNNPLDNSSSQTKNICLILSKSTKNSVGFFNFVQYGIEDEAKKQGLNIIIYYYDENENNFETPLSIKDGIISGIITLGRISKETLNTIMSYNLPLVVVDHYFNNININYILTDNISGGYCATEYLINHGIKKISFLGDIKTSASFSDRYEGYLRGLKEYNLSPDILIDKSVEEISITGINSVVEYLNNLSHLPEGFFCCNDAEAVTLIRGLTLMGVKIPEEVSVIGFDNIEFSQSTSPELTTMMVEKELMGKKAVEKLINIINNENTIAEKLLITTRLIERGSVKNKYMGEF